eukprot:UN25042
MELTPEAFLEATGISSASCGAGSGYSFLDERNYCLGAIDSICQQTTAVEEKSVGAWYGCEEYRVCYYRCKECRRCDKWECIDTKCDRSICDTENAVGRPPAIEEEAVGDDAEVVCTLPDPNDVVDYQYFYPNVLSGCTSKNCDNPTIMGPFSCTSSSTLFG